jgi:hypothetical protein
MSYWIIQGNPKTYCMDYLGAQGIQPDTWTVDRYADEIHLGDVAFIWLSEEKGKENRGIYAMATVMSLPDMERQLQLDDPNVLDKEQWARLNTLPKLDVIYIKLLVDNPLLADDLKSGDLGTLQILQMPQWGVYKLAEEEGQKIRLLVERR